MTVTSASLIGYQSLSSESLSVRTPTALSTSPVQSQKEMLFMQHDDFEQLQLFVLMHTRARVLVADNLLLQLLHLQLLHLHLLYLLPQLFRRLQLLLRIIKLQTRVAQSCFILVADVAVFADIVQFLQLTPLA